MPSLKPGTEATVASEETTVPDIFVGKQEINENIEGCVETSIADTGGVRTVGLTTTIKYSSITTTAV